MNGRFHGTEFDLNVHLPLRRPRQATNVNSALARSSNPRQRRRSKTTGLAIDEGFEWIMSFPGFQRWSRYDRLYAQTLSMSDDLLLLNHFKQNVHFQNFNCWGSSTEKGCYEWFSPSPTNGNMSILQCQTFCHYLQYIPSFFSD